MIVVVIWIAAIIVQWVRRLIQAVIVTVVPLANIAVPRVTPHALLQMLVVLIVVAVEVQQVARIAAQPVNTVLLDRQVAFIARPVNTVVPPVVAAALYAHRVILCHTRGIQAAIRTPQVATEQRQAPRTTAR